MCFLLNPVFEKKWQEGIFRKPSCQVFTLLFNQEMRTHMTVNAIRHFLVHGRCMRLTMTGLAFRHIRMLTPVTKGTGKCLVLGRRFFHLRPNLFMTRHAEGAGRCNGRFYLQRMMGRMAAQTVAGNLTGCMRFVALGTIRDLAVDLMAEGAGLLGMGRLVIGEILARSFVTGETRFPDVIGKVQGQWFMRIGVTGEAVLQFKMRPALMAHGTRRDDFLAPWRVFLVAVQAGDGSLVLAAVAGYGCRFILMAFDAVSHLKRSQFCFCFQSKSCQHHCSNDCCA